MMADSAPSSGGNPAKAMAMNGMLNGGMGLLASAMKSPVIGQNGNDLRPLTNIEVDGTKIPVYDVGPLVGASGSGRTSPYNPTGGKINCVDGVCAFLNSVKTGRVQTAVPDAFVIDNGGKIQVALDQIEQKTGVYFGKRAAQFGELTTARERQFFVVFEGVSTVDSNHVAIGIFNNSKMRIYDPQSGEKFNNISDFRSGKFTAYPLLLQKPIRK